MNTLNVKRQMWEMSGIDPTAVTVDENGDTYGFYTDINGVRLKDESGQDLYGLAVSGRPLAGLRSTSLQPRRPMAIYCLVSFLKTSLRQLQGSERIPT